MPAHSYNMALLSVHCSLRSVNTVLDWWALIPGGMTWCLKSQATQTLICSVLSPTVSYLYIHMLKLHLSV